MRREYTQDDFDQLSWHDNEIRSLELRIGEPDNDDWTSDLVLDIDYIAEWVRGDDGMAFRVAPATLVFHGVTDLRIALDSGDSGHRTALLLPSIATIERERILDQKVYLDRPYYHWRIRFNRTPDGEISFGAVGFSQTLRREPVLCRDPRLDRTARGPSRLPEATGGP